MFHHLRSALLIGFPFVVACTEIEVPEEQEATPTPQTDRATSSVTLGDRLAACSNDPRVLAGLVSRDICVGADLFLRETFGGNGRSCATCHPVDNNFAIDVPFISTLPPTDPIFIAENVAALSGLEIPAQMRGRGLILENLDGFAPDPTVNFVLRSVPHNLSMGTSVTRAPGDVVNPPLERTGWSGDGAPGAGGLRDFQTGAITQHYPRRLNRTVGTDFRLAEAGELDRIDLFMRQLGRTNELALATVVMTDAGAEAGRQTFLAVGCNGCHGNAGANASFGGGGNRNFNTGVENARNAALAGFPRDGGFLSVANPAGGFGDGSFNTPPLVEAADTGPFFHTDTTIAGASAHNTGTAQTIEEAIAFYDSPAFNNSPSGQVGPINIDATQIENIGRFLRGVNASFNVAQARKRLDAARILAQREGNNNLALQRRMLQLSLVEVIDAVQVLQGQTALNRNVVDGLNRAIFQISNAQTTNSLLTRGQSIAAGLTELDNSVTGLGTNLVFTIGNGTLMF